jgi:hypothetical protein
MRTESLGAVMKTMGHRDVKTAVHYWHPELEVFRAALDNPAPSSASAADKDLRHIPRHTSKPSCQ